MKLYRGDSSKIDVFIFDKTDKDALLGSGLYLTSDKTIAKDYTHKSSEHIVFPTRDFFEKSFSQKELFKNYFQYLLKNTDFNQRRLDLRQEYQEQLWVADDGEKERLKTEFFNVIKEMRSKYINKLKRDFKHNQHTYKISKNVDGEYKLVMADRHAYITEFDIPETYLKRVLHAERPLPNNVLNIIRSLFISSAGGDQNAIMDLRDRENSKRFTFDDYVKNFKKNGSFYAWADDVFIGGNGANPSLDEMWNGNHMGFHVFTDGSRQLQFINEMRKLGYVGLEYDGGKRITGSGGRGGGNENYLHRAFVFWDVTKINSFKVGVSQVDDDDIDTRSTKWIRI